MWDEPPLHEIKAERLNRVRQHKEAEICRGKVSSPDDARVSAGSNRVLESGLQAEPSLGRSWKPHRPRRLASDGNRTMFFTNWPSYSDLLSGSLIGR